jgi:hypothetical protein
MPCSAGVNEKVGGNSSPAGDKAQPPGPQITNTNDRIAPVRRASITDQSPIKFPTGRSVDYTNVGAVLVLLHAVGRILSIEEFNNFIKL